MANPVRALGLCGSLRKRSFNAALLRAAAGLCPSGMSLDVYDLAGLPFYNGDDVPTPGEWPEPARTLRERIAAADALVLVTPEYNYSIAPVLKNAIDWASRAPAPSLDGKPVAIMSAATGLFGGVRAQLHLPQVCVFTNMFPLNKPEVLVPKAADKFDVALELTDAITRELVQKQMAALAAWTRRLRGEQDY
jgi:chromate reductase, NAD(P)H dehydrogenase (quinone)